MHRVLIDVKLINILINLDKYSKFDSIFNPLK